MAKLLRRWYVWLGLVLLLGFAGSVALICSSQGRITQANVDRINADMTQEEVTAILGDPGRAIVVGFARDPLRPVQGLCWEDGRNSIIVYFENGHVLSMTPHFATSWETLQWYARKGAAKIGVNWD